jgi:hypothetical protein
MKKLYIMTVICLVNFFLFQEARAVHFIEADGQGQDHFSDDVVVHTKNGKPILPDLERHRGKKIPVVPNEITFSFNSPDYPWSAEEIKLLQQWVDDFYPVIKIVYGDPAFEIVVNVRKDPTIGLSGLYFPSNNEMVLRELDAPIFCHELIHAFRDDLMMYANIYEEGMTRAAEIAVFSYLPQYSHWDSRHSYGLDTAYDLNNQPAIASVGGSYFSGFANVLLKYQQAGYAWGKIYIEDHDFFLKYNARYYVAALSDASIQGNVEKLKSIASGIKHTVEKQKFADWYANQYIFNINPEEGYQTFYMGGDILYVFRRDEYGRENMLSGINVSWEIFSCQGASLSYGSAMTTDTYGWVEISLSQLAYHGKVRIDSRVYLPDTTIERSFISTNGPPVGIFGVTAACDGEVQVRGKTESSALVVNGAFSMLELKDIAGTFTIKQGKNEKTVTKDASDYFVSITSDEIDRDHDRDHYRDHLRGYR